MVTPAQAAKHRINWRMWLAIAIFGIAVTVAFLLPTYYAGCRPGWYHWNWGTAANPSLVCGLPPPADDWGYPPYKYEVPLKIAIGIGGALLARAIVMAGRRRRGVAVIEASLAMIMIGLTAFLFLYPTKAELTGQVGSDLRCLDPGCEGMTVEQAVMSERSFDVRYPKAHRAWWITWHGLYDDHISTDAIKDQLVAKYGEQILL
jgi:cytochrome bd-type quinol oxidase subunit 2